MKLTIVLVFICCSFNIYAGNAYFDCLNGCTFGANIGNDIAKAQDRYSDIKTSQQIQYDCSMQCTQAQASQNSNAYVNPTITCRPDGFGNLRCN